MPSKVKIFNLNNWPLQELFKGDEVLIEPLSYWKDKKGNPREFDIFEANDFKGQYHPVPVDGSGKMLTDPKYFKMLRMDPVDEDIDTDVEETSNFKCMAKECKHVSPSPEELDAHIKVRHPNVDRLVLPEVDLDLKKKAKKTKLTDEKVA